MPNNKKTILLVDDNPDFLTIFSIKLEAAGFRVVLASGGEEALKLLETQTPDLMLLDVDMPGLNGADVLAKIKADGQHQNLRVAFLTNLGEFQREAMQNDDKFAKEFGAVAYIRKTDDLDHISDLVKRLF